MADKIRQIFNMYRLLERLSNKLMISSVKDRHGMLMDEEVYVECLADSVDTLLEVHTEELEKMFRQGFQKTLQWLGLARLGCLRKNVARVRQLEAFIRSNNLTVPRVQTARSSTQAQATNQDEEEPICQEDGWIICGEVVGKRLKASKSKNKRQEDPRTCTHLGGSGLKRQSNGQISSFMCTLCHTRWERLPLTDNYMEQALLPPHTETIITFGQEYKNQPMKNLLLVINPTKPPDVQTPNRGHSYMSWCKSQLQHDRHLWEVQEMQREARSKLTGANYSKAKACEPPFPKSSGGNRQMAQMVEFWDHACYLSGLLGTPMHELAALTPGMWHASIRQVKEFNQRFEEEEPATEEEMQRQKAVEKQEMHRVLMELHNTEQNMVRQDMNENLAHHAAIPLDSDGEEEPFEDVELP